MSYDVVVRTTGRETRLHIDDVRTQIERALDPSVQELTSGRSNATGAD